MTTPTPLLTATLAPTPRITRPTSRCEMSNGSRPSRRGVDPPDLFRSEEHTSELQSLRHLVCRLLLEKKKKKLHKHLVCRLLLEKKKKRENTEKTAKQKKNPSTTNEKDDN